jgi:uncharacterized protein (TIGR02231 family)
MNKRSILLPVLLSSLAAPLAGAAAAAELTPESRVVEVTVYRQAALVTREARLTLPPGDHTIVLDRLPAVADPDSVRVSGTGPADIQIGGVEVQKEFQPPDLTPGYRQIQAELDDLNRRLSLINDRRQSIAALREFVGGLKASNGQESSRDVLTRGFAVESWQKAFDFLSSRLDSLSSEERRLDDEQKDLNQKIDLARGRQSKMTSQGGSQRWSASVSVAAPRGGELTLRASYLAMGASWLSLYDARLDPATGRVGLSWLAQVSQNTGEDWNGVAVTLATARPLAGIDLPVLASLDLTLAILGRNYQDILTLASGSSEVDASGNPTIHGSRGTDVVTAGAEEKPKPIQIAVASAARREVAVTFALPGLLDIPSDGQPHKQLIATRDMPATIEYRAVPLVVPAAFLVARVTLTGDVPLLSGKVQHFVGGDLVGTSMMAERAAGEEFSLSFGPDDRLTADRRQIRRSVDRRGKIDETAYRFVTTLESHLGRESVVEVKDRIPVSGDGRIEVTLDDETTPGSATDPNDPGILTWKVPVPKDGKREIALVYKVRSPHGVVIAGLE